ncbi:hypothetical protein M8997_001670 [Phyllobacterium sp. 21LDTY02-6]|uniref:hypothetical protein n=1 Tax=Phyllobacterium sp. 21LDTY02-6 TaxID=2944903 RepID=UPI002021909C|nr:hypothetical protein [Phyllobacterium sp. 21LDTY02-6]MCO4315878.1 hypothetical protein [Phyllobacterium sp. 21LDTY02-6]
MNQNTRKNSPERVEVADKPSRTPIETQDWDEIGAGEVQTEEVQADDELAITGGRQVPSADADGISEDDDDNAYQESDAALPDDEEEAEITADPEREGHRFND